MKYKIFGFLAVFLGMFVLSGAVAEPAVAAKCTGEPFLGFVPWYNNLQCDSNNAVKLTDAGADGSKLASFIWTIILNIAADLMLAIGYIAVGFVMYGGYLFIVSNDNPGTIAKARKTITFALTGAVIAILASAIIHVIIGVIGS